MPLLKYFYHYTMQWISADIIHDGKRFLPANTAICLDDNNRVVQIASAQKPDNIKHYNGLVCPAFINAHCHLELSDMLHAIPRNTGLVSFLSAINERYQQTRDIAVAISAAKHYDNLMHQAGIAAVADICNTKISFDAKHNSKIYYHNYLEVFGSLPQYAQQRFKNALALQQQIAPSTITPHACYSISQQLWQLIKNNIQDDDLVSIHNQESAEEDKLIKDAQGDFINFLQRAGITEFTAHGISALMYNIKMLGAPKRMLFVHNTYTTMEDIAFAQQHIKERYWCVCPNANMYIEQKINHNYVEWHRIGEKIVIGTDSLASNHELSIAAELYTLHQQLPNLSTETSLQWATSNGAQMLGKQQFGVITEGVSCKIINISNWQTAEKVPQNPNIQWITT